MVKIRLKRLGYKKNPIYRVVVINSSSRREGAPIEELGYYNPKTKELKLNKKSALEWVKKGAQPSETVAYLIKNADDEGKLVYKPKTQTKLSKKAQAKAAAAKEAKETEKKAAAEAKAAAKAEEQTQVEQAASAEEAGAEAPEAEETPAVTKEISAEESAAETNSADTAVVAE